MNLNEYQQLAMITNTYPERIPEELQRLSTLVKGLCGESGEVSDKLKKAIRDGYEMGDLRYQIAKELGDVLWYVSQCASEVGYTLDEVACMNIDKLRSRYDRGVIGGSGDNR